MENKHHILSQHNSNHQHRRMYKTTTSESLSEDMVARYLLRKPNFVKRWFKENATNDLIHECIRIKQQKEYLIKPRASITHEMFNNILQGNRSNRETNILYQNVDYMNLNEHELFTELIRDIANELNVDVVCHKILTNVSILTNSDRGSLFLARGPTDARYLVSKLFDVTAGSTLEQSLHTEDQQIIIPFGKGIAGHVASTKEYINIPDAYEDPRFNKEVDIQTGYRTHSICCMPILNKDNVVIGVAQIINKKTGTHEFTHKDLNVFRNYLTFCGIGLSNAQLFELSIQEFKKNQLLLTLARNLFREQSDLEHLIRKITVESQGLLQCTRCCVYILEKAAAKPEEVRITKGFDMIYEQEFKVTTNEFLDNSRYAKIAYHVARSMETVNLSDIGKDATFTHLLAAHGDDNFILKNILCVPIFDKDGKVIGVAQMMNKINERVFTDDDVAIIEAFSIFCGLGINNTQMYENVMRLTCKQKVAFEVLSYHVIASEEDVLRIAHVQLPDPNQLRLYSWDFNDMVLTDDETILASVRMFTELDLIKKLQIPHDVICRWVLSVKKNYRPVIYHNWRHGFNVAQTMFAMLTTGGMNICMNDLERLGLLVACLSHDLDHRGTNNAFQAKVDAPLAKLYSTSTLEHHHFDQCIMIVNSEGNNIFQSLSAEDYKTVIKYIESAILSTDLALYFRKRGDFQKLVENNEEHWTDPAKKELLRGMMMTACDVAAICKPWEIQQVVAKLVASEFFQQGDIERTQLHVEPIPMMDRAKKDELPKMQVGFIDSICLPLYKTLADVDPSLSPLFDGCKRNRSNWEKLAQEHEKLRQLWSENSQENLKKMLEQTNKSPISPLNKLSETKLKNINETINQNTNSISYKIMNEASTTSKPTNTAVASTTKSNSATNTSVDGTEQPIKIIPAISTPANCLLLIKEMPADESNTTADSTTATSNIHLIQVNKHIDVIQSQINDIRQDVEDLRVHIQKIENQKPSSAVTLPTNTTTMGIVTTTSETNSQHQTSFNHHHHHHHSKSSVCVLF